MRDTENENLAMLAQLISGMFAARYECHCCGERHSHVVEMADGYDPESRGEYCSNCIVQKRKDGWRAI